MTIWEDSVALNSREELGPEVLESVAHYVGQRDGSVVWDERALTMSEAVSRDADPLPIELHRELYYGPNHYNYWASGLRDWFQIKEWGDVNNVTFHDSLDLGCASGRLIRHLKVQGGVDRVMGCDINRLHVEWAARNLRNVDAVFQNTSMPTLPIESGSLDLITAFSVFTHIESFDTAWLMEIRRLLKPGGVAWLTVHGDRTWRELQPTWPLYAAMDAHADFQALRHSPELPQDRLVFRWISERSYSSNVFYRYEYLKRTWGRILDWVEVIPTLPAYQDIVVLRR